MGSNWRMVESGVTFRGVSPGWVIFLRESKLTLLQSSGLSAAVWAKRAYCRILLACRCWEPAGVCHGSLGPTGADERGLLATRSHRRF